MQTVVQFLLILASALVATAAINTYMMETHMMPKQVAGRIGVVESPSALNGGAYNPDRQDANYTDFWLVDHVPC